MKLQINKKNILSLLLLNLLVFLIIYFRYDLKSANIFLPLIFEGDVVLFMNLLKNLAINFSEYFNGNLSYPFDSPQYHFPIFEHLPKIILITLSLFSNDLILNVNLMVLLSFFLNSSFMYIFLRAFSFNNFICVVFGLYYAFLPYALIRIGGGHFTLIYYFIEPLFFLVLFRICFFENYRRTYSRYIFIILICIIFALSGLYYVFFKLAILSFALFYYLIKNEKDIYRSLLKYIAILIVSFLTINASAISKNIVNPNNEVGQRLVTEQAYSSLRIPDLVMPLKAIFNYQHRKYQKRRMPNYGEGRESYSGYISTIALFLSFYLFLYYSIKPNVPNRPNKFIYNSNNLYLPSFLATLIVVFFSTNSFGYIFNFYITPVFRSQSRIIVLLNVIYLFIVAFLVNKYLLESKNKLIKFFLYFYSIVSLSHLIYQPTFKLSAGTNYPETSKEFIRLNQFIEYLDNNLSSNKDAIMILPYTHYPEGAPVNKLNAYEQLKYPLLSSNYQWSSAMMRGTREHRMFDSLYSLENLFSRKSICISEHLNYKYLLFDKRGFEDNHNIDANLIGFNYDNIFEDDRRKLILLKELDCEEKFFGDYWISGPNYSVIFQKGFLHRSNIDNSEIYKINTDKGLFNLFIKEPKSTIKFNNFNSDGILFLYINGQKISINEKGESSNQIKLTVGMNTIKFKLVDSKNGSASFSDLTLN